MDSLDETPTAITLPMGFIDGFASANSMDTVLEVVAHWVPQMVGASRASVALAEGDQLVVHALKGEGLMTKGFPLSVEDSMTGEAYREQRTFVRNNCADSDSPDGIMLRKSGLQSCINAPLLSGGECFGTLNVAHPEVGYYRLSDAATLGAIATWIASHFRIHRQVIDAQKIARTDGLTGTLTRRALFEAGNALWETYAASGTPFVLAVLDLDRFKAVNDTYGHAGGDAALLGLADEVRDVLRESDHFGRLGGEEFGVLVPGMTSDLALGWADRLRERIERLVITDAGSEIGITVSVGLALPGLEDDGFEGVYRRADAALYEAKDRGRNMVQPAPA